MHRMHRMEWAEHGGPGLHFGPGRMGRHGFGGWGGEDRGRGGGHGDHGGHGRRRLFDSGELRLVLLKLIADAPRHGYELIRAIEELTGGAYMPSPGVVYPTLSMLQDLGQIAEAPSEGARKAFAITAEGQAQLAASEAEIGALFARLADLRATSERTEGVPVRRALDNLRAVLRHRLSREDVGKDMLHDVADILDEAARRIERL
jgi:DNA-binding PadR family transcriptional regulator